MSSGVSPLSALALSSLNVAFAVTSSSSFAWMEKGMLLLRITALTKMLMAVFALIPNCSQSLSNCAFCLSEEKMIVPVDEKRGRLLFAEILDSGNFGKHFSKYGGFTHQSMGKKYFLKIWRNMHFVRYYSAEALCEPLFQTWHFFWRLKYKK